MKKYSEVKWSEVLSKALAEYIGRLEIAERGVVSSTDLAKMLKGSGLNASLISVEKAIESYAKARNLEWRN